MKTKNLLYVATFLFLLIFITGCQGSGKNDLEEENNQDNPPIEMNQENSQKATMEELKEILMESVGIELKDTDNQAVGMLQERQDIMSFVDTLFSFPHQEEYPDDTLQNEVIGPLYFYRSQGDDIYGLVKEKYIYIEGYYFLIEENNLKNIEKQFEKNIIKAPSGDEP
ncbi:hypothetical protein [Alkaliphilus crotonatoxidans]